MTREAYHLETEQLALHALRDIITSPDSSPTHIVAAAQALLRHIDKSRRREPDLPDFDPIPGPPPPRPHPSSPPATPPLHVTLPTSPALRNPPAADLALPHFTRHPSPSTLIDSAGAPQRAANNVSASDPQHPLAPILQPCPTIRERTEPLQPPSHKRNPVTFHHSPKKA